MIDVIDSFNDRLGRYVSWLAGLTVLVTLTVVILRYVFDIGFVWMQELYVWFHGILFMAGAAYTYKHDGHVRVDVFYSTASVRYKSWVNLLGVIFLLWPLITVLVYVAVPYVQASWSRYETSAQAGGMHGVFILKSFILVFCFLMALQSLSVIGKSILNLWGKEQKQEQGSDND